MSLLPTVSLRSPEALSLPLPSPTPHPAPAPGLPGCPPPPFPWPRDSRQGHSEPWLRPSQLHSRVVRAEGTHGTKSWKKDGLFESPGAGPFWTTPHQGRRNKRRPPWADHLSRTLRCVSLETTILITLRTQVYTFCHLHSSVFPFFWAKGMGKKASSPCFPESSSLEQGLEVPVQNDGARRETSGEG